jgi:hypothetical protein
LTPDGVDAVNASPVKKVDCISAGFSLLAGPAALAAPAGNRAHTRITAIRARIAVP